MRISKDLHSLSAGTENESDGPALVNPNGEIKNCGPDACLIGGYMKRYHNKSTGEKWGLFALLIGTLGFTLSMNPDHFNHIARNEGPVHKIDLAATDAAAESTSKTQDFQVRGKKGFFKATAFQVENKTFVKFVSLVDTEGKNCELCSSEAKPMKSGIDKASDLSLEIQDIVDGKGDSKSSQSSDSKADSKGVELEDWAKKCEKLSGETQLTCHKNRILELSKTLKNDADSAPVVLDYFNKYLSKPLQESLFKRTVTEMTRSECDGQKVYEALFGQVGCQNLDELDSASEMVGDLIKGLKSENGRSTTKVLLKLQALTFAKQLRNAQLVGKEAQRERNPSKEDFANRNMLFETEMTGLIQARDRLQESIESSSLTSTEKANLRSQLNASFYQPVKDMYEAQRTYVMNATSTNLGSQGPARSPFDFTIPNLDGENSTVNNSSVINRSARAGTGEPGNLPAGSFSHRTSTRGRGAELPPLGNVWGTQRPGEYNSNFPVSTTFQPVQPNYNSQFNQLSPQSTTPSPDLGRSATRVR
jgi:hypothetical protein